jgi:hypothetical protein
LERLAFVGPRETLSLFIPFVSTHPSEQSKITATAFDKCIKEPIEGKLK